ncbi:MAG: TatD family hydrolase [Planctomycetota bacterium]|nr:TatD family hydrolase [Planctomycetota bacterium]
MIPAENEPTDLVDIGVNLTNKVFQSDFQAVMQRAREASVGRQIVTGTSLRESQAAIDLAAGHPGELFCTVGVHPHNAKDCNADTIPALREMASQEQVVAIGECGLDYNRDFSPRPAQLEWFEKQVELSIELQMPLFIHERDAAEPMLGILRQHHQGIKRGVVHCFTGNAKALAAYLELDLYIGITGWICDERRGLDLRELVKEIPLDRLMIETDAPYLTPHTIDPKPKRSRNEPAFLRYVLEAIASSTNRTPAEVAVATTRSAEQFFGLKPAD